MSARSAPLAFIFILGLTGMPVLAAAQVTGDEEAGREAFAMECRACHNGAIAPSLRGVVGRKIASQKDYPVYSDALKAKSKDAWAEDSLNAFLKGPTDFAPGTKMTKIVADDQARADIIAYLKSLPAPKE